MRIHNKKKTSVTYKHNLSIIFFCSFIQTVIKQRQKYSLDEDILTKSSFFSYGQLTILQFFHSYKFHSYSFICFLFCLKKKKLEFANKHKFYVAIDCWWFKLRFSNILVVSSNVRTFCFEEGPSNRNC